MTWTDQERSGVKEEASVKTASDYALSDFERKVYDVILAGNATKDGEIAEAAGISLRSAYRVLSSLEYKGFLKRTGNNKNGCWLVVKKIQ
ncbi:MAG: helix-turn-helix domain-containing protein [Candidatus Methanoplasma sp.]|jgi:sugar-specific transcriptional regulator TrmB|nr:helix-turn-helix domain-containing protein [Candidatus Methanoplasma sp.]